MDFLLTSKRDTSTAHMFLKKAINNNGLPNEIKSIRAAPIGSCLVLIILIMY
ncbi:MAG: hypothetical protein HQK53_11030 [Oligoflexia bacterium]|nr:hypothetical protein [Oligoflexia bacterium]